MSLRKYFMRVNGQTYEELGAGLVRVTEASGTSGVFRVNGEWVEGDLRQANIHMLIYTGGPTIPEEFNYRWPEVPVDTVRPSGWPEVHERYLKAVGPL